VPLSPAERSLRAKVAAYARWADTPDPDDRRKATEPGRRAAIDQWMHKADPDGVLSPEARRNRAEALRRQHMALIAFKSSTSRRAKKGSTTKAVA